ncbi:aldehyde dehydrogenase family protein [Frankia sp. AiPs1]|uniref:aldehyde dehydrogenase family protein n=1 Tax=Frankia sp. AiPs1 TaxID=573493 RepID=UPI00204456C5|nr:aldehyde dehydrogenase family protein [Frankia sp. AiPs1]MCM3920673.1 aldehyde dehydrogenase family protein [Frankia sp. AiPs1]
MIDRSELIINGELVAARSGRTFDNGNPATEELLGVAADAGPADLDAAVTAARHRFDRGSWSTDPALRAHCLRQLQTALQARIEQVREVLIAETGCTLSLSRLMQVEPVIADIGYVADLAESYAYEQALPDTTTLMGPASRVVRREPVGVVGAITPWNFPLMLNLVKVTGALAAGNTVVLKPAPDTPWTAALLGQIALEDTDLPPGVLNVVTSADHGIGAQLTAHRDVDLITFTGSTATGRAVMASAAGTVKRTFLELGGKSASIVLDDADLGAVVGLAASHICFHAGQGCALATRILVPRSRYTEAVDAAEAAVRAFPYGDPMDPANMMGPLISDRQRTRVLDYINVGRSEAKLVCGGERSPRHDRGFYVEPTLFVDVDPDARIAQEEIFGPVVTVLPFDDDDDAVAIANNSIYGLSGVVSSGSVERAMAVARRLRTGTVAVNNAHWLAPDSPFGGYKQSGLGRENGIPGFESFLEIKTIGYPPA